jgi:acyl carrier protein
VTRESIRAQLLAALVDVAPDVVPDILVDDRPLREQVDIDSYDLLQFVVQIHERLGVDIPEGDYARIDTIGRLIDYLAQRLA